MYSVHEMSNKTHSRILTFDYVEFLLYMSVAAMNMPFDLVVSSHSSQVSPSRPHQHLVFIPFGQYLGSRE